MSDNLDRTPWNSFSAPPGHDSNHTYAGKRALVPQPLPRGLLCPVGHGGHSGSPRAPRIPQVHQKRKSLLPVRPPLGQVLAPTRPWLAPLCWSFVQMERLLLGSVCTCLCFWVAGLVDPTPRIHEDKEKRGLTWGPQVPEGLPCIHPAEVAACATSRIIVVRSKRPRERHVDPTFWKQKSPTFTFQGLIGATFPRTSLVFTHGSDSPQTQKTSCPLSQRCSGLVLRVSPGPGLFRRARNPPGSFLGGALALEPRLHLQGVSHAGRQHVLPWLPQNRVSLVTVVGPFVLRGHTGKLCDRSQITAWRPPLPLHPCWASLVDPTISFYSFRLPLTNFLSLHLLVILSGAFPDFRSTPLMKVLRHTSRSKGSHLHLLI